MSDLSKIAQAGKDFACGLYRLQPGALIPTPFSDALHFVWDSFCGDPPRDPSGLPPPPVKPFDGGQCCDIDYKIDVGLTYADGRIPEEVTLSAVYQGTILGLTLRKITSSGQIIIQTVLRWKKCDGRILEEIQVQDNEPRTIFMQILRVYPAYGVPDICGNPPPQFPPALPPPPGGYTSPPTAITFNDNSTQNYEFNFSPPPAPAPIPGNFLPPVVINFNSLKGDFKIPMTFNFNGDVNFGGGGEGGFTDGDRDKLNSIKNAGNITNNTTNNINDSVQNFYSDYKKDKDKDNNKPLDPTPFDPPKPAVLPGKYQEERLAFVEVNLSTIIANKKSQSGAGAPDVIYAGWFEFLREGKSLPRQPIHFENNCFVAPVGADGYAFTLYTGYQGTAVAITNKE